MVTRARARACRADGLALGRPVAEDHELIEARRAVCERRRRPRKCEDGGNRNPGSCDPASLFVRKIGPDANRGDSGWVYKVGNRQGTTGAADPSGPFGSGRIKRRVRVTWFYCVVRMGGCQRTLGLRVRDEGGGTVSARVTAYDDEGRGTRLAGATVHAGGRTAETDSDGTATLALASGSHRLYAEKDGFVRSFAEKVRVE